MDMPRQRLWVSHALTGLLCLFLLGLVGRLTYIHAVMSPQLLEWSERRQRRVVTIPGRRGQILDRRHRVLAGSVDRPMIFADPRLITDHADAAAKLAPILNLSAEQITRLLDNPSSPGFVIIKRGGDPSEAEAVQALNIRGLSVQKEPSRCYPMGPLAAQVVGFLGSDGQAWEGIERTCDQHLRASPGRRVVYKDVRRRAVFQEEGSYVPPTDGRDVVLTLDTAIQDIVEKVLLRTIQQYKAESAVGIVMDPRNGDVLAMANVPSFDPARASTTSPDLRRNRILTDPVEPGSIFKPFVMSATLSERLTKPSESIFCHNGLYVTGKRMLHDHHPYGTLTVEQIMTKSSNIGMAILGQRLGNAKMYAAMHAFGFGEQTGIDLPGEGEGLLMPLRKWTSFSTTSVPMGQELAITPIQMANGFAAIANGGLLLRPRVVAAIVDANGRIVEDRREMEVRGQALDAPTVAVMKHILTQVVEEGTGTPCRLDKWMVMGKTGTAQVPRKNRRGYEPDAYLASFVAAAPVEDPAVVVLVMVRKPDRRIGYYGGKVSAPAVRAILEEVLPYLNVPPSPARTQRVQQVAFDLRD